MTGTSKATLTVGRYHSAQRPEGAGSPSPTKAVGSEPRPSEGCPASGRTHLLPARHGPLLLQALPEQLQQVVRSRLQLLPLRLFICLHRQNLQQERKRSTRHHPCPG